MGVLAREEESEGWRAVKVRKGHVCCVVTVNGTGVVQVVVVVVVVMVVATGKG